MSLKTAVMMWENWLLTSSHQSNNLSDRAHGCCSTLSKGMQCPIIDLVLVSSMFWSRMPRTPLHVCFLLIQPWSSGAVIQETVRGHDHCETFLTTTNSTLKIRNSSFHGSDCEICSVVHAIMNIFTHLL